MILFKETYNKEPYNYTYMYLDYYSDKHFLPPPPCYFF